MCDRKHQIIYTMHGADFTGLRYNKIDIEKIKDLENQQKTRVAMQPVAFGYAEMLLTAAKQRDIMLSHEKRPHVKKRGAENK